jgi:hypothetical protein
MQRAGIIRIDYIRSWGPAGLNRAELTEVRGHTNASIKETSFVKKWGVPRTAVGAEQGLCFRPAEKNDAHSRIKRFSIVWRTNQLSEGMRSTRKPDGESAW